MAILSKETVLAMDPKPIDPFNEKNIIHGAYELALSSEAFITSENTKHLYDNQIAIPPGQCALLITEEEINMPLSMMGLISIKANVKVRGLINISGFHVDPGFNGKLKFSVYNAGAQPVILDPGRGLFLLWFCMLDHPTRIGYDGNYNNQQKISGEDVSNINGDIASPGVLKNKIDKVEQDFIHIKTLAVRLIGGFTVAVVILFLKFFIDIKSQADRYPVEPKNPALQAQLEVDKKVIDSLEKVILDWDKNNPAYRAQMEADKKVIDSLEKVVLDWNKNNPDDTADVQ